MGIKNPFINPYNKTKDPLAENMGIDLKKESLKNSEQNVTPENIIKNILETSGLNIEIQKQIKTLITEQMETEPKLKEPKILSNVLTSIVNYAKKLDNGIDREEINDQIIEVLSKVA